VLQYRNLAYISRSQSVRLAFFVPSTHSEGKRRAGASGAFYDGFGKTEHAGDHPSSNMSYPSLATGTGRNIDMAKTESDLAINIRKATSIEETAPKRKHVRSCIVYTWDHRSSLSFWAGMKGKPDPDLRR
jgi:hypothetical protein